MAKSLDSQNKYKMCNSADVALDHECCKSLSKC